MIPVKIWDRYAENQLPFDMKPCEMVLKLLLIAIGTHLSLTQFIVVSLCFVTSSCWVAVDLLRTDLKFWLVSYWGTSFINKNLLQSKNVTSKTGNILATFGGVVLTTFFDWSNFLLMILVRAPEFELAM